MGEKKQTHKVHRSHKVKFEESREKMVKSEKI